MTKVVKVIGVDVREDSQGRAYKNVKFATLDREVRSVGGVQVTVKTKSKISSFNAWEESYLDQNPEYGWDAKVGDHLIVSMVTAQVETPYQIGDREVSSYTAILPGVENATTAQVAAAFNNAGHNMVDSEGVVHAAGEERVVQNQETNSDVPA